VKRGNQQLQVQLEQEQYNGGNEAQLQAVLFDLEDKYNDLKKLETGKLKPSITEMIYNDLKKLESGKLKPSILPR
jgi:hypothetical protein